MKYYSKDKTVLLSLPLFLIFIVLPLAVGEHAFTNPLSSFQWHPNVESYDIFLYYKSWVIILAGIVMLFLLFFKLKNFQINWISCRYFSLLAIYIILSILSAICSEYSSFCYQGAPEQYESLFVLTAYAIFTFYAYICVQNDYNMNLLIKFIFFNALLVCLIGLTQFFGADIYEFLFSRMGYKFTFEKGRVYASFYNPNYVGSYAALIIPLFAMLLLIPVSRIKKLCISVVTIGLVLCLAASKSSAGFFSVSLSILLLLLFIREQIISHWKLSLSVISAFIVIFLVFHSYIWNVYIDKIWTSLTGKSEPVKAIEAIKTSADNIEIIYKGNTLKVAFNVINASVEEYSFEITDDEGNMISSQINAENSTIYLDDERFEGITIAPVIIKNLEGISCFSVNIDGKDWYFTNEGEDGTYYYINSIGKLDKMNIAPSALFTNWGAFASGRGYIWARTIPLLKDYILLGSGPDTFSAVFPNDDYLNAYYYGYNNIYISRPHNTYLQTAVQTGMVSLILWLIFYGIYFIRSIKLYWTLKLDSSLELIGLGIFIGTAGYMLAGFINDSSVTVAPFYWIFLGTGIAINKKLEAFSKSV